MRERIFKQAFISGCDRRKISLILDRIDVWQPTCEINKIFENKLLWCWGSYPLGSGNEPEIFKIKSLRNKAIPLSYYYTRQYDIPTWIRKCSKLVIKFGQQSGTSEVVIAFHLLDVLQTRKMETSHNTRQYASRLAQTLCPSWSCMNEKCKLRLLLLKFVLQCLMCSGISDQHRRWPSNHIGLSNKGPYYARTAPGHIQTSRKA